VIEELKRLIAKVAPGQWKVDVGVWDGRTFIKAVSTNGKTTYRIARLLLTEHVDGVEYDKANAAAIAALINNAPALIAAAEAVRAYDAADQLARVMMSEDEAAASIIAWREAEALIFAAAKGMREVGE
jgi:hypothetical protein